MKNEKQMRMILAGLLVLAALVSFFLMGSLMTDPETYASQNAALKEQEEDVLKLTASTAAISAAITLIPDDIATPLAEKVADVGGYMLLALCAVYVEKYLLTITGFAAWKILFPAAFLLLAAALWKGNPACKQIAGKLVVLGLALILVIPVSLKTSEMIQTTYEESISETIRSAEQAENEFSQLTLTEVKDEVLNIVNRFMRVAAVYIVITCLFPILVLFFFVKILNLVLGTNIRLKPVSVKAIVRKELAGKDMVIEE